MEKSTPDSVNSNAKLVAAAITSLRSKFEAGRHTFISHALAGGRTLAEVHDAAGHSNVSITSIYLTCCGH